MIAAAAMLVSMCVLIHGLAAVASAQPVCERVGEAAALIETVRDYTTRVPLAGAAVTATWSGGGVLQARTDSLGTVRICAPPNRAIQLTVSYHDVRTRSERTSPGLDRITAYTFLIDAPWVALRGMVVDNESGDAVAGVFVKLANTPLTTTTGADGRYLFARVPVGDYRLDFHHISYAAAATSLRVRDEDLMATVRLTPGAIALEPVIVNAYSIRLDQVGFYERKKRGVGSFLDRKQVEAMNVQTASDLLRKVPGMRLIPQTPRRNSSANATIGRGNCRFTFVVDGSLTLRDFEMDAVAPHAIEGIEVYSGTSEIPANFRAYTSAQSTASCGIVAIWTRDGR